MSDLDADLYGDLYGDDGTNDFVVPTSTDSESRDGKLDDTPRVNTPPAPVSATPSRVDTPPSTQPINTYSDNQEHFSFPSTPAAAPAQSGMPIAKYESREDTPQPIQTFTSTGISGSGGGMSNMVGGHGGAGEMYASLDNRYKNLSGDSAAYGAPLPVLERQIRPSEMKDDGKMFIGGLNWDTTDEGLKTYFEQFGKVDACTIMRDMNGRSRCFAFLTFDDPASVNAVMVREHFLDGKVIDPKRAIPRQEHVKSTKLFIGGLPPSVTSETMREHFSQYGKVVDSTVMVDRDTGRSKGFGFLSFEGYDVEPILGFGKVEIDEKLVDIKLAQPRHQREGGGREGGESAGAYTNPGGFQNRSNYNGGGGGGNGNQMGGGIAGGMGGAVAGAAAGGGTPFDPQALAQLYTRMFQQFGTGGGMGMMGGGGMAAGMGMNGMAGGGMGGMGMNNMPRIGGAGGGGMGGMGAMGIGGGGMGMGAVMGGSGMSGRMGGGPMNAPRGPRGAPTGPQNGVQRTQRSHGYHPYSR